MTVRWKPLLLLSGLFLVIAVASLLTFVYMTRPDAAVLATKAQENANAGLFANAEIHYQRALQLEPANGKLHEQLARMYEEWIPKISDPTEKAQLLDKEIRALKDAQKHERDKPWPLRRLLELSLLQGQTTEAVNWAKGLIALEPGSPDAHYVLGLDAMDASPPDRAGAEGHLNALASESPRRPRTDWLAARIAGEGDRLKQLLEEIRGRKYPEKLDLIDQLSAVKLRYLDAQAAADLGALLERVDSVLGAAKAIPAESLAPAQLNQLKNTLEDLQGRLAALAKQAPEADRQTAQDAAKQADDILDQAVETALKAGGSQDLRYYQIRAEHLLFRNRRDDCLKVIADALATDAAEAKQLNRAVLALKDLGVRAALSDSEDKDRFKKTDAYIEDLIADQGEPYYNALGHLYRGAVDLERSGLAGGTPSADAAALRDAALNHLKQAAAGLPEMASAQALYGIALLIAKETGLGRQYLQKAQGLGPLEPRYQIWAAWSMIQAGYPEEAARIAAALEQGVAEGKLPQAILSAVRLLQGEASQASRTPEDLQFALARYEEAAKAGDAETPALRLRKAQVYILLGQNESGDKRKELVEKGLAILHELRKSGEGGPSAEQLAVLTLADLKRMDEARQVLDVARGRYPDSGELATIDAGLLSGQDKAAEGDKVLAEFLKAHPNDVPATEARAKLLSAVLKRPDEARALLTGIAERSQNSGPLIQLADLDLAEGDLDNVTRTVARIRERWPEAAAADLIETQVEVARGDYPAAAAKLAEALRKDPNNKVALYWKGQIDIATGATADAARIFDSIARDGSTKEIQPGLPLNLAAKGASAAMALQSGDSDKALREFEALAKTGNGPGSIGRNARWQLIGAYAAKGDWAKAEADLKALLADKQSPPTEEERIRAASLYRQYGTPDAALAILDDILKGNPGSDRAAILKALTLYDQAKLEAGAEALRAAIAASKEPTAQVFLVLAAFEYTLGDKATRPERALKALDAGLLKHKDELALVEARYRILKYSDGEKAAAAYVESVAPNSERLKQFLIAVYRDQKRWQDAERAINDLRKAHPNDRSLTLTLAQVLASRADQALAENDPSLSRQIGDEALTLIRSARKQFKAPIEFLDLESDIALRRGDMSAAISLTQEMDQVDKASPAGALKRARLHLVANNQREAAQALKEALERSPQRIEVRIQLSRLYLGLGDPAGALEQANLILDRVSNQPDGTLLKAQALMLMTGSVSQVAGWREEAAKLLKGLTAKAPKLPNAYTLLADARALQDRRPEAIAALKDGLKANPNDPGILTALIYRLAQPRGTKAPTPPPAADLAEANALAKQYGAEDKDGRLSLALAMGFGKADQVDLAIPWAKQAVAKIAAAGAEPAPIDDVVVSHLSLGSLLMTKGDKTRNPQESRAYYEQAADEYGKVIQANANVIEAVNNRAWILHKHLGENEKALEVASEFAGRNAPRALPTEFLDTLGSIQAAVGQKPKAEETYKAALDSDPDSPILNFRLGCLISEDTKRTEEALACLRRAEARIGELRPENAKELKAKIQQLDR